MGFIEVENNRGENALIKLDSIVSAEEYENICFIRLSTGRYVIAKDYQQVKLSIKNALQEAIDMVNNI